MEPIEEAGQRYTKGVRGSSRKISVLVVDDDSTCLTIVAAILRTWEYEVVTVKHPIEALCTLRKKQGLFDLVVTDYHMPDMNGLELQEQILEEFKLPVIIMSGEERECIMLKCLDRGAAFYILKPVRPEHLQNIWQYAVATRKGKSPVIEEETICAPVTPTWGPHKDITPRVNENSLSPVNKMKGVESNNYEDSETTSQEKNEDNKQKRRKPKVFWTTALQNRFLQAISIIGFDNAVPRRILDVMNVPGITRANVASHLQKYRLFLRKVAEKGLNFNSERTLRSSFASAYYASCTGQEYHPNLLGRRPWMPTFQPGLLGESSTNLNYRSCGIVPLTSEGGQASSLLPKLGIDKSPSVTDQTSSSKYPILGNTYTFSQPKSSGFQMNQLDSIEMGSLRSSDALYGTSGVSKQMTRLDQTMPEQFHHGVQKYKTVDNGTENANHAYIGGSSHTINSFPNLNSYKTDGYVGLHSVSSSSEIVQVSDANFSEAAELNNLSSAYSSEGTSFMPVSLSGHQKEYMLLSNGLSIENTNRCAYDVMGNSLAPSGSSGGQQMGDSILADALSGHILNQPLYKPRDGEKLMLPDIANVSYQPNPDALTIENHNLDFLKPNHVGNNANWNNVDIQDHGFGEFVDFDFLHRVESFLFDDPSSLFDQNPAQEQEILNTEAPAAIPPMQNRQESPIFDDMEFDEAAFVASLLGDNF